jgi:hypothetical protein
MLFAEWLQGQEVSIGRRRTPGLDVVASLEEAADVVVEGALATAARKVVPDCYSQASPSAPVRRSSGDQRLSSRSHPLMISPK